MHFYPSNEGEPKRSRGLEKVEGLERDDIERDELERDDIESDGLAKHPNDVKCENEESSSARANGSSVCMPTGDPDFRALNGKKKSSRKGSNPTEGKLKEGNHKGDHKEKDRKESHVENKQSAINASAINPDALAVNLKANRTVDEIEQKTELKNDTNRNPADPHAPMQFNKDYSLSPYQNAAYNKLLSQRLAKVPSTNQTSLPQRNDTKANDKSSSQPDGRSNGQSNIQPDDRSNDLPNTQPNIQPIDQSNEKSKNESSFDLNKPASDESTKSSNKSSYRSLGGGAMPTGRTLAQIGQFKAGAMGLISSVVGLNGFGVRNDQASATITATNPDVYTTSGSHMLTMLCMTTVCTPSGQVDLVNTMEFSQVICGLLG